MFIAGPRISRAVAMVRSISKMLGSSSWRMAISSFTRKFWTITSWILPCSSCTSLIAKSESMRSSHVSPMPMRMPVVNAIPCSPAKRIVSSRSSGILPGQLKWASPLPCSRSDVVSSISPIETLLSRSDATSSRDMMPGFAWGSSPVSLRTRSHCSRR